MTDSPNALPAERPLRQRLSRLARRGVFRDRVSDPADPPRQDRRRRAAAAVELAVPVRRRRGLRPRRLHILRVAARARALACSRRAWISPWMRGIVALLAVALVFALLFVAAAEWLFLARVREPLQLHRGRLSRLLAREVVGNIRASYPVGKVLAALAAIASVTSPRGAAGYCATAVRASEPAPS